MPYLGMCLNPAPPFHYWTSKATSHLATSKMNFKLSPPHILCTKFNVLGDGEPWGLSSAGKQLTQPGTGRKVLHLLGSPGARADRRGSASQKDLSSPVGATGYSFNKFLSVNQSQFLSFARFLIPDYENLGSLLKCRFPGPTSGPHFRFTVP